MKKWQISDIRWASEDELNLPLWQKWNKDNPLPDGFWQRIWEYPYLASKIPANAPSIDIGGTYPFILFKNWPQAVSVDNRDLNILDHKLHKNLWPKKKLIIADAAKVPVADNAYPYSFSISAIEEMPHTLEVLKEMLRITKYRLVVTMDVSDNLGMPTRKIKDLEKFLNIKLPNLPYNSLSSISKKLAKFNQNTKQGYRDIRVLALTIDSLDEPADVAILIPHWNSYNFLNLCLKSILANSNSKLNENIYILDDSSTDGSYEKIQAEYGNHPKIKIFQYQRPNKKIEADIGLLLDYGLKEVTEQYVATIDADLFPLNKVWLAFPIWLLNTFHCSSVGLDTGLSVPYQNRISNQHWWQPIKGYTPRAGQYDNEWFTCTNNLYRIMNTAMAKMVSEKIGFSRATPCLLPHTKNIYKFINKCYKHFRQRFFNSRFPYLPGGEDNGVAANHFIDINKMGPKFNLPLTSYIGLTPKDGAFGQNISGLAFHFALSTRALSSERREVENTGTAFAAWVEKIQKAGSVNDQIIQEMIAASTKFQPGGYDGSIPQSWYVDDYNYIQELLNQYGQL